VLTAQDDPFIPFESFRDPALHKNGSITLLAPLHGGHCGFVGQKQAGEDRYWAENRVMEFIRSHSKRGRG
jgi:predicted alpha/beta-fold hydrolase